MTQSALTSEPSSALSPGFIALHGNRIEELLATAAAWLQQHPLAPLETEIVLVQSNGMAEWVKMSLARSTGVCAAAAVQLPARFLWQTYRQVLGRSAVPVRSPLDKSALSWRLMRLLPALLTTPGFEPIAAYLPTDDRERCFQLAQRIADLYDQYQVHRPDWLDAWAGGAEVLIGADGGKTALAPDQRWQALLWQQVLGELDAAQLALVRPQVHKRVLVAINEASADAAQLALPRRAVVFGMSHLPLPTLELLAALSRHSQVLLAIPNPCRFHWADIIDGRELLRFERHRQPLRKDALDRVNLEEMHLHAHPLLAAWGRQARDFVRQLDAFDDAAQTRKHFPLARIDLFEDSTPDDATLLAQVQAHIRDLVPLAEHLHPAVAAADRSIVFHIAHSPVRELEILHDQLLSLLAAPTPPGGKALRPRDIVVMVPAIDDFAPAIRAVFGQYGRDDPRHIPFDIADLSARGGNALSSALQWLLQITHQRCRLSDLCALLDVPAIAARFGIAADQVALLTQWMSGAGMRWGLDAAHRASLGLDACGEHNSALFGVRRMLMGFAVGSASRALTEPFAGIEPYAEIGGLDAELAGACANLVERLLRWQSESAQPASPQVWAERIRALCADLLHPTDDGERSTVRALDDALDHWLEDCADAGFSAELPLPVAGEACLAALDAPVLNRRFRAGGITFCTLMPMRAIPFEVVCLLGMNDGDYPRRSPRSDFDLMALPKQHRPGDRARRDDDRQLMLDALLSARRVLYISWCGRSVRDNSEQPPSVLVAQLRDYLAAGWSPQVVDERTQEHPLQPFSRRYFEEESGLRTWAREWSSAHTSTAPRDMLALPLFAPDAGVPLRRADLAAFLRSPAKVFFRQRLDVVFDDETAALPDDERFALTALEEFQLVSATTSAVLAELAALTADKLTTTDLGAAVERALQRSAHGGELPLRAPGARVRAELEATLQSLLQAWHKVRMDYPLDAPRLPLRFEHEGVVVEDWLDQRIAASAAAPANADDERSSDDEVRWLALDAGRLLDSKGEKLRPHKLLRPWVNTLLAAASGQPSAGVLIGRDTTVHIKAMGPETARTELAGLLDIWRQGLECPLPVAPKTAFAWLNGKDEAAARNSATTTYEGSSYAHSHAERDSDACLARCFADFASLSAGDRFTELAQALYGPVHNWIASQLTHNKHPESNPIADESI